MTKSILLAVTLLLAACGGGGGGYGSGSSSSNAGATYTVGGMLSGLAAGGMVVLQNNGGNNLTVTQDGAFTFSGAINYASDYNVTVLAQPTGQTCTVTNGAGAFPGMSVTTVTVTCR